MATAAVTPSTPTRADAAPDGVASAAAAVNAKDLFVFRRVAGDRYLHVGGVGRGTGWAGVVELQLSGEPHASRAAANGVHTVFEAAAAPMFGPYYAPSAAFVTIGNDVMVVFGHLTTQVEEAVLRQAAADAAREIEFVSPAKRLADELEILHAVKAMAAADPSTVREVCEHIARSAAEALSCETAILYRPVDDVLVTVGDAHAVLPARDEIMRGMRQLFAGIDDLPECVQDITAGPLPFLGPGGGARAYYTVPVGSPATALLVLIHTDACPRGFTLLCQELGLRLAETGASLLRTAELRERLEQQIEGLNRDARRDALTGLSNRLGWDERLDDADAGAGDAGVLIIDLDNLKAANDSRGHDFGDKLIVAMAALLRAHVPHGFLARLGGDEFAVLLNADEQAASEAADAVRRGLAQHPDIDGFPLSAAVGHAARIPGGSLRDAVSAADKTMYDEKRRNAQREQRS